ncbi:MAG: orc1/cdc6 family replication initiation protein [archaeon]
MPGKNLSNFFEEYINKEPIFTNKKALQSGYTPNKIPHRQKEIEYIAKILAPILRQEKPSNIFIYGKTGTGKTVTIKHVTDEIYNVAERNSLPVKIIYLNCKLKRVADTEYRLVAELTKQLGVHVPATGLPTDEVYRQFVDILNEREIKLLVILDEIDQIVHKIGADFLYNMTRLNTELKQSEISIVGISNDLHFTEYIDPRVKSSLSEEEILFPPYNAVQIQTILKERSKESCRLGVIKEGVIEKCAALAAKEHGDARKALELLRVAGEMAERKGKDYIEIGDLDEADDKLEKDRTIEYINVQPKQSKITLLAIINKIKQDPRVPAFTGDIYEVYKNLCFECKITPLTQRRISDLIAELDQAGIIRAKLISKGRYGRTRQICLEIGPSALPNIEKLLKEGLNL